MNIDRMERVSISLNSTEEIEAMRHVIRLAAEHMQQSTAVVTRGAGGIARHVGLIGPELFRVRQMLVDLGRGFGIQMEYDDLCGKDDGVYAIAINVR